MIHNLLHLDSELYNGMNYNEKFTKLTNELLDNVRLVINKKEYKLREIELYLYTDDHPDIYTHRDIDQKTPGGWYFHKKGNTYKGGTYKGLDITFGYKNKLSYGGILIRAISNDNIILGPCKSVDKILEETKFDKIQDLVTNLISLNDVSKESLLYIKYDNNNNNLPIYKSPRVGLSYKYPEYAVKNYRYLNYRIKSIEKYKPSVIVNLINSGKSLDTIAKEAECTISQVKKYMDLYESGKKLANINELKPSNTNMVILTGFINK